MSFRMIYSTQMNSPQNWSDITCCARPPKESPNLKSISGYQMSYAIHQHNIARTQITKEKINDLMRFDNLPTFLGEEGRRYYSINWVTRVTNWSEDPIRESKQFVV